MTEGLRNNAESWGPRIKLVLIGFSLIGAFFLLAEHRAHVLPFVPWLLLAACPLMHFFMHGRHGNGGHQGHGGDRPGSSDKSDGGSQ